MPVSKLIIWLICVSYFANGMVNKEIRNQIKITIPLLYAFLIFSEQLWP